MTHINVDLYVNAELLQKSDNLTVLYQATHIVQLEMQAVSQHLHASNTNSHRLHCGETSKTDEPEGHI